jgi:hypothetical protein
MKPSKALTINKHEVQLRVYGGKQVRGIINFFLNAEQATRNVDVEW